MTRALFWFCWMLFAAGGCAGDDDAHPAKDTPDAGSNPATTPKTTSKLLTDFKTLAPTTDRLSMPDARSPLDPDARQSLLDDGFGEWKDAAGEAPITYVDGDQPPKRGKNARRLVRFAHLADLQLSDDESPGRVVNLDQAGPLAGAFRPQESDICRMINAMVATLNRVHAEDPLSFVLLGGDNADNAQQNEIDWALSILGGADQVECDSGENTDLVPGPDNDGKDPFSAPGLAMPFYWVTGNHDVLIQGTAAISDAFQTAVIGQYSVPPYKLRDFSLPGGPASSGPVPADPNRRFLTRPELMQRVLDHAEGHGLSMAQVDSGKAIYTFDVPNTPLRFIVIDTAAETGGAEGVIHRADVDKYIKPALDQAQTDEKWVIMASHHAVRALSDGGGLMGVVQPDALTGQDWVNVLGNYPNVLFSLVAHDHADHIEEQQPDSGHAYWELTTCALADYPHQSRIVEIWDEDNGYVSLQATYVDIGLQSEPIAEEGRHLGVMDYISGWNPFFSSGDTSKRNASVYIKKP
jgi:hypothetical protein